MLSRHSLHIAAVAATLGLTAPLALAQNGHAAPPSQPRPGKEPKKVWREDDLAAARKSWHEYQDQQAAAVIPSQEKTAARQSASHRGGASPAASVYVPDTPEGIEERIRIAYDTIWLHTGRIREARMEYFDAPEEARRAGLLKRIALLETEIENITAEMAILEAVQAGKIEASAVSPGGQNGGAAATPLPDAKSAKASLPTTISETHALLGPKFDAVEQQRDLVARYREEFYAANGDAREDLRARVAEESRKLEEAEEELRLLQQRFEDLHAGKTFDHRKAPQGQKAALPPPASPLLSPSPLAPRMP